MNICGIHCELGACKLTATVASETRCMIVGCCKAILVYVLRAGPTVTGKKMQAALKVKAAGRNDGFTNAYYSKIWL